MLYSKHNSYIKRKIVALIHRVLINTGKYNKELSPTMRTSGEYVRHESK